MSNAPAATADSVDAFIARWEKAEAAERANYQMFLTELCELLELPHPDPAALAAHFGKRTKKRVQEIDQILETLRNLGQL